jgi:hypothetical protein
MRAIGYDLAITNASKQRMIDGMTMEAKRELLREILTFAIRTASPERLREYASMHRAKGYLDQAHDLEMLADMQERE